MLYFSQRLGPRSLSLSTSYLCFKTTLAMIKARITQLLIIVGGHEQSMLWLIPILVVRIGIDTS